MLYITVDPSHPADEELLQAAGILKHGGIAIYPTETVYGMAAIYNEGRALERLFAAKGRRESNPVLLLIESIEQLNILAEEIPERALALACRWWPGPLTLMFKARPGLSPYLTGEGGKVACRISSHSVAQRLVQLTGCPITSTSANFTGCPGASRIDDVSGRLLEHVDVVVDAGAAPGGLPSTLLDVSARPFRVIRQGAIPAEQLI